MVFSKAQIRLLWRAEKFAACSCPVKLCSVGTDAIEDFYKLPLCVILWESVWMLLSNLFHTPVCRGLSGFLHSTCIAAALAICCVSALLC